MDYDFLDEIPINVPQTLHQLLGRFQTVKDGLPEIVKNSKDQYANLRVVERSERVIVVLVNTDTHRIGVLDFAGALAKDFVRWRKWSDPLPSGAKVADDIEAGHGNGGKGFMVRGSTKSSSFESCRDGYRTKMGYSNEEERAYKPAFVVESGERVDNQQVKDPKKKLEIALKDMGVSFAALPDPAKAAFAKRQAYSLVQLNGVRDWDGRRPAATRQSVNGIPEDIVNHPQAALTIETCSVFFVVDGKTLSKSPLERSFPEPMAGFEKLPPIAVPPTLEDPATSEPVATGASGDGTHYLQLHTVRTSLRITNAKALNVIRVRNARNVVGNWSIPDMHSRAESGFIFGELRMPSLAAEHQVGADRVALADTPLVRSLQAWVAEQVVALANKIQKAKAQEHKPEEIDKANDELRKMRDLMREFLEDMAQGSFSGSGGKGSGPGTNPPPPPPPRYGTVVRQIVLEGGAQSVALAQGTTVPLIVRAYDLDPDGGKLIVKGPQLELQSDKPGMVSLSGRRVLSGDSAGRVTIWFVDRATGVTSNRVEVEVVVATGAEIRELPARLLLQGEEIPLRMVFNTKRGSRADLLVEARTDLAVDAEVDEPLMGRVDRYGVFTAGGQEGTATIRVRFGARPTDTTVGVLQIGPNRVPPRPRKSGGERGSDVPIILLCGVEAPGMEQFPEQSRTIPPSELYPTIIDYEPAFEDNVIFINPDSKESQQMRSGRGGRRGVAGIGSDLFSQFLALKCFEILKRLYVRQLIPGVATETEFRNAFAEAELRCAPFVDRAFEIAHGLEPKDPE